MFDQTAFLRDRFTKEIFWSFYSKGITFLLFLLLNIYLARSLGTEKFGMWSFFFSIFTIIFVLSHLGINASTKKYVAQYSETEELRSVLESSVKLRVVISLVFAILVFMVHWPLATFIRRPEFAPLFMFSAPLILFAGLAEFLRQVFIGLRRLKYNFIINFLEYGLKLLLVVFFFSFSSNLLIIINSFTIATFIASIIGFYCLYKKFYHGNYIGEKKDFIKNIFRYSLPLFLISIGLLLVTEIDILMLGLLSTDIEVGIYAIAKQIIVKLPHISLAIAMGAMPVFARLSKENKKRLKNLFYRLLRLNTFIFLLIAMGILSFSHSFIPLIVGADYSASVLPLQILTVYLVCFSFLIFLNSFLDYQGLAKKRAINFSFSMILNITLNFLLIPKYGAVGAASATSVSYLPYLALNWIEVKKCLENI